MATTFYGRDHKADYGPKQPIEAMFFLDQKKLRAFKPTTKGPTWFRPYAAIDAEGNVLPTVIGTEPYGPVDQDGNQKFALVITNLEHVSTVTCEAVGGIKENWFTGLVTPSDRENFNPLNSPMGGTYVKLRKKQKDLQLEPEVNQVFTKACEKRPGEFSADIGGPQDTYLVLGTAFRVNGEDQHPPVVNAVLVLQGSAATAYEACIRRAYEDGKDLLDPQNGFDISFGCLPKDMSEGRNVPTVTCVRGRVAYNGGRQDRYALEAAAAPMPLPPQAWPANWLDIRQELKRYTYDELMAAAVKSYGAYLVSHAFPEPYEQWAARNPQGALKAASQEPDEETPPPMVSASRAQTAYTRPPAGPVGPSHTPGYPPAQQAPQQARPAAPVAPPVRPAAPAAPAQAPANDPWGMSVPTTPGVQVPVPAAPQARPAAPVTPPAAVQAASLDELTAQYNQMLAGGK